MTTTRDREMISALAGIADVTGDDGRYRIVDYAPDSTEPQYLDDDGTPDTAPGSTWHEECDRLLAEIRAALPEGWSADWSDDDIVIEDCHA